MSYTPTLPEILRSRRSRDRAWTERNDAADGFDPSDDIDSWTLVREAETTDDVSIYTDGDDIVLVGTDATGCDDSRWAVRIEAPAPVTDEDIEALRAEAGEADDMDQVVLCDEAVGDGPEDVRAAARAKCERIIRSARASAE